MIGGSDDEMRLVALAVAALTERIDDRGLRRPALLDDLRQQLAAWSRLEPTNAPGVVDPVEGDAVMIPLLLTKTEAAGLLSRSERSVDRAVAEGRLRAVRDGRSVRFRRTDLDEFVASLGGGRDV